MNIVEDEEYMLTNRPGRERGILRSTISKKKDEDKVVREKRAKSEERNKNNIVNNTISIMTSKDSGKKEKGKQGDDPKKQVAQTEVKQGKKQHKIRRKLLMGGLIRRKNRSMPDLREGQEGVEPGNRLDTVTDQKKMSGTLKTSQDDSNVGLKGSEIPGTLSGYLSEGHLEYAGGGNPNLERSRLMRKSFHGSAGKVLHAAKVPPPPPLRTTSQLTSKPPSELLSSTNCERPQYPLPSESLQNNSNNIHPAYIHLHHTGQTVEISKSNLTNGRSPSASSYNYNFEPQSLQYLPVYNANASSSHLYVDENHMAQRNNSDAVTYANSNMLYSQYLNNSNKVITQAEVHQEQNGGPLQQSTYNAQSHQQDDSFVSKTIHCDDVTVSQHLPLPPYPSPLNSVSHSRQASEDFPPPPPPLELDQVDSVSNVCSKLDEPQMYHLQAPQQQQQVQSALYMQQYQQQQAINAYQQQLQQQQEVQQSGSSLLVQLQQKRQQILAREAKDVETESPVAPKSGEEWLKELQAKQAERKLKKMQNTNGDATAGKLIMEKQGSIDTDKKVSSVKDLASRFENIRLPVLPSKISTGTNSVGEPTVHCDMSYTKSDSSVLSHEVQTNNQTSHFENANHFLSACPPNLRENRSDVFDTGVLSLKARSNGASTSVENHMTTNNLQSPLPTNSISSFPEEIKPDTISYIGDVKDSRRKSGKKKNVTFCDQVILVATAEDEEEDSYIPNPILERVLRSAFHKQDSQHPAPEAQVEFRNGQISDVQHEAVMHQKSLDMSPQPYSKLVHANPYNLDHRNSQPYQQHQDIRLPGHPVPYSETLRIPPHLQPYVYPPDQSRPKQMYQQCPDPMRSVPQNFALPHIPQNYAQQTRPTSNGQPSVPYPNISSGTQPSHVYHESVTNNVDYHHQVQQPGIPLPQQQYGTSGSHIYSQKEIGINSSVPKLRYSQSNGHVESLQKQQCYSVDPQQPLYPPYQHPPPPTQPSSVPKTVQYVTKPQSMPVDQQLRTSTTVRATPCNLCRKKHVVPPAVYCTDCDFYMSRFRPRN